MGVIKFCWDDAAGGGDADEIFLWNENLRSFSDPIIIEFNFQNERAKKKEQFPSGRYNGSDRASHLPLSGSNEAGPLFFGTSDTHDFDLVLDGDHQTFVDVEHCMRWWGAVVVYVSLPLASELLARFENLLNITSSLGEVLGFSLVG